MKVQRETRPEIETRLKKVSLASGSKVVDLALRFFTVYIDCRRLIRTRGNDMPTESVDEKDR